MGEQVESNYGSKKVQDVELTKTKKKKAMFTWLLFLAPTLIGILLFIVYPVFESVRLSFYSSNGTIENWVGLRNYERIIGASSFWNSVYNTFFIGFFQLLIAIPLGFILASMINRIQKFQSFFKVLFFLPNVTSIVAAAMIFAFVLQPELGLLNHFLSTIGLPTSTWLSDPSTSKWGVILLTVWHWLGFVIIICLANLQAISPELYEASEIDGASGLQQWFYITIPNMAGTFAFLIIMGWISGLQRFNEVFVLGGAGGSPNRSLQTMVAFIYERGFGGFEFGIASAATCLLFIIILLFTMLNLKLTRLKI
ncbi:carbohydrate ABC transporter permease [Alkalicoccobacillus plakortidis]|uniref:Sugar ABC transporter permease n=1 Tax=Alkalicoccobacillus plakortidis TaxID=444060 RepID=A0ABT0XHE0_9BACI|nr:sugar ABC transporter permease [Alkalicoccobacillus plakortidis]MCM2675308.1 sugar ABC transporter permease [Alkalicoccobacillus plakortidis]